VPRTVLILHSSAGLYGADLQLLAIARGLEPSRWRAVCVLPERGRLGPLLEDAGARLVVHPLAVLRRALLTPRGLASLGIAVARDRQRLGGLARESGAAVVHANTSVVLSSGPVARRARAAHLVHVREIYAGSAGRAGAALWPLMRRRLLRADALACISRAVADQFAGAAHASVLYDGLPKQPPRAGRAAAREALGVAPERFAVALIGRVSDWKGQEVLARALARPELAEIGTIGLVAGDPAPGDEHRGPALDSLAASLGLGRHLLRLGFREDVETVLGAADALVVPSTRPEPLGLVAMEAAAAGLPVVASAHGGVVEIVRHGETGLLVPPGDSAALAVALRALAEDPERGGRMGQAGARDVARRFPCERMLAELQALYDRLAEPARP
jgi:glycosyltransferase involved in cell wall biosynthesis